MTSQTFRPSSKFIKVAIAADGVLLALSVFVYLQYLSDQPVWLLLVPLLFSIVPLRMVLRQMSVKMVVDREHLVLETGLLSKSTRTINIAKVQDVTVAQSLFQRMLGIGDLRVETAGQGSTILARGFDQPRQIADLILRTAHTEVREHGAGL